MIKYVVEIFEIKSGFVIREIPCSTENKAQQVERGLQINMHLDYSTRIVERDEDDEQ